MKLLKQSLLVLITITLMLLNVSIFMPSTQAAAPEHPKRHVHKGKRPADGGFLIKDTATILGIEPQSLLIQLQQGKTLLQVAQSSKGLSEQEYLQKLTTLAHDHLNQAVLAKRMTSQHAEEIKAKLPTILKKAIHHRWKKPEHNHTSHFSKNMM